jgi:diaminopimelate decarboxylase
MKTEQLAALAKQYGTPLYVFDTDVLTSRVQKVREAFSDAVRLCFSIKANPFLTGEAQTELLEVCSPGELNVCAALHIPPARILYSGVNKTQRCIEDALDYGVRRLTAESPLHLSRIERAAAERELAVELLLRLSGGDQFGMDADAVRELVRTRAEAPHVRITGLHFFSGTQKRSAKAIERELKLLSEFADSLMADFGFETETLEYGAGLFADYFGADAQASEERLLNEVAPLIRKAAQRFSLTVEMGRFFAASCGFYITAVEDVKSTDGRYYAILDGGIHQINYDGLLLAPAPPPVWALCGKDEPDTEWTLCGSLCSRGDVLARGAILPNLTPGDVLCFGQAGAYAVTEGMALFLSRDLPAVAILSDAGGAKLVRGHRTTHALNTPEPHVEETP